MVHGLEPSFPATRARGLRPAHLLWLFGAIGLAAAGTLLYFLLGRSPAESPGPPASQSSPRDRPLLPGAPPQPSRAAAPGVPPAPPAATLAPLDQSDGFLRAALVDTLGREGEQWVRHDDIARRFVASVDNLTRDKLPNRIWLFNPVPGPFVVDRTADRLTISPGNYARYRAVVDLVTRPDVHAVVAAYRRFSPWFEQTYRMLGYPGGGFDRRVISAMDDLLDTPEPVGPIALVQPHVLYEFADPDLQALSAGQKMMIRVGPESRARLKARLVELRSALLDGR